MPEAGSEQQRFKNIRDIQLEILNIEREMKALDKDAIYSQIQKGKYAKELAEQIKAQTDDLKRVNQQQQNLNRALLAAKELYERQNDSRRKAGAAALYDAAKNRLKNLELDKKLAMVNIDLLKDELAVEHQSEDLHARRLEKTQNYLAKFGEIFGLQKKHHELLKESGVLSAKWLGITSGIFAVLEQMFSKFLEFDAAAAKTRKNFGLLRQDSERIYLAIRQIGSEFAGINVKFEDAAMSAEALANEFGGMMKVSKDLVETSAILKAQLGVAEENSAGFLRNISALSKASAQSSKNFAYIAARLSSAAGVPLNMVMQDVAKLSGNALGLVSRLPSQIIKTAIAARELGTTINKMADASAQLLNFTENVQAEMEASVLTGQAINLQKARELAYHRDIEGSTREILKIAKQIDFQNLDFFQMQSFAAATGRSADEILRMIQAQRQLQEAKGIEGLSKEVAEYERLRDLREGALKDEGLQREISVKQMANQERILALQAQWNKLIIQATETFYPIIDGAMRVAGALISVLPQLSFIGKVATILFDILEKTWSIGTRIGVTILEWIKPLQPVVNFITQIGAKFMEFLGVGGRIAGVFGKFLPMFAPFLKIVPVVGWVLFAFQAITSLWKNFNLKAPFFGLDKVIDDLLFKPFRDAWNWIKGIFVGHSPSKLAMGIVQGLIGAQSQIFDALTYPFRQFLAWIADKIPGMGGIANKLRAGMTGALQDAGVLEKKVAPIEVQPTQVAPTPVAAVTATPAQVQGTPQAQQGADSTTLSEILKAINLLNSNLSAGKIGVYLDGQLLSATLARQTSFRGGYGVNQVSIG